MRGVLRRITSMKRKITALGLAALMGLSLTACAAPLPDDYVPSTPEPILTPVEVVLLDGRTVPCIVLDESMSLACDWDGASE